MILRSTKLSASASRKSTASWRHGSCNQEWTTRDKKQALPLLAGLVGEPSRPGENPRPSTRGGRSLASRSGDVAATDAVTARVAACSAAGLRASSSTRSSRGKSARISSAPPAGSALRGLASPTFRDHAVEGLRLPVLSARNPRNAEWGQRSTDPRLALSTPARRRAVQTS
jgi:hypothetical protein